VYLYRYTTKGTFDAYLYQILESKQRFISQIMTSKNPVRSADNIDDATLNFAEVKALCTGDSRIKEKLELDTEVAKLKVLKDSFKQTKYRLESEVNNTLPALIGSTRVKIEAMKKDIEFLTENHYDLLFKKHKEEVEIIGNTTDSSDTANDETSDNSAFEIEIEGVVYNKRKEAAEALNKAIHGLSAANIDSYDKNCIGEYAGMKISVILKTTHMLDGTTYGTYRCRLKNQASYFFDLSYSMFGSITRIENQVSKIPTLLTSMKNDLVELETKYQDAVNSLKKYSTFDREDELTEKEKRLKELNIALCAKKKTA
jgi:phage host-nuclease inhibitor protein Gam